LNQQSSSLTRHLAGILLDEIAEAVALVEVAYGVQMCPASTAKRDLVKP